MPYPAPKRKAVQNFGPSFALTALIAFKRPNLNVNGLPGKRQAPARKFYHPHASPLPTLCARQQRRPSNETEAVFRSKFLSVKIHGSISFVFGNNYLTID
jgi:hypothetical protein